MPVQQMYDSERETVVTLVDDPRKGRSATQDFSQSATAHPQIRYKDLLIECDLYETDGQYSVHLICPRCHNFLKIESMHKTMEWDGKTLSVEPFECTWELGAARQEFGVSLCRWRVGVQRGIAKDA